MKNTKIVFSGIMAAILATGGANAASGIASVDYVNKAKSELNTTINNKADKATTLAGYGITDAYTQTETDQAISDAVEGVISGDLSESLKGYVTTVTYDAQVGDVTTLNQGLTQKIVTALNEVDTKAKNAQTTADGKLSSSALDAYQTKEDADKAYATKTEVTNLGDTVTNLNTTINNMTDEENGFAAQIAEVKTTAENAATTAGSAQTTANNVQTVVGATASEGLRKQVADNTAAIADINNAEKDGSLAKQVADNTANIEANTQVLANKANADAVYDKTTADSTFVKTADFGNLADLAKSAPADCATEGKTCALTFDGTDYVWEVVVR